MPTYLKSVTLLLLIFLLSAFWTNTLEMVAWTPLASTQMPRVESASAVIGGRLYVFGGFINEDLEITNTVEVYNPSNNTWSYRTPMPVALGHTGFTVVEGKVWLVAGFAGNHPGTPTDVVQIYDPVANTWSMGPPLPRKLASGTLMRLGRKLHHVGGLENRNDDVDDHYVLDLDNPDAGWTSAAPLPMGRNHLGGAAFGGKLYAIGGQYHHDQNRQFVDFLHMYDPTTDTWTRLADLPDARSHFESSTMVHEGRILIGAGLIGVPNNQYAIDFLTAYNPTTNTWTELEPLPDPLVGPTLKALGNTLILANGGLERSYYPQQTAYSSPAPGGPGNRLGFWPQTIHLTTSAGATTSAETLLWTVGQSANYTINLSTAPAWLTQVSPATGSADVGGREITLQVNASGLAPGTYTTSVRATASGLPAATLTVTLSVTSASAPAFKEQDGQVVIEAEHYHNATPRGNHEWKPKSPDGSIGAAVEAAPNNGTSINTNYVTTSPELQYQIDFTETGTYYVWTRAWASDNTNDSWHVGLDGAAIPSADRISLLDYNQWTWVNKTLDQNAPATFDITTPGRHIVNLWMREDGLLIDRLLFTTDPNVVPSGAGPQESDRSTPTLIEVAEPVPRQFSLEPNYPNPFNPATTLRFTLAHPSTPHLSVYDLSGRLVARLVDEPLGPGTFEVVWHGHDEHGLPLPSGVYFARLETGTFSQTRSMLLVK